MAVLVQKLVDQTRRLLKDTGTLPRWTDEDFLDYINETVTELQSRRPDAFFDEEVPDIVLDEITSLTTYVGILKNFNQAVVYYMAHLALNRDSDDHANVVQANNYLSLYMRRIS